jgi:DNA-binding transcriptional ArsR family regulator
VTDEDPTTAGRYEWERIIRRARLGAPAKAVALAMATYADGDGSRVYPGIARLVAVTELSDRSVRGALKKLRDLGLIERTYKGGHRGVHAVTDVHRLTIPVDLLERVEMLDPTETPRVQPAGDAAWDEPQPAPGASQPAPGASQPAPDVIPTGTRCTPPVVTNHTPPTDQRDHHLAEVTTDRTREDLDEELFALNGGRRRMHR